MCIKYLGRVKCFVKKVSSKDILGAKELKYFGDLICTMNGTSLSKVVMKSFEEQGLIGLCAKHHVSAILCIRTWVKRYHFLANIWGPSLFVILLICNAMDRPTVNWFFKQAVAKDTRNCQG